MTAPLFVRPPPEPESAWFGELLRHLLHAGVCAPCAVYYAIVTVEREYRRKVEGLVPPVCTGKRQDRRGPAGVATSCKDKVRGSWPARPRRVAA
jgi:hypothetical protein